MKLKGILFRPKVSLISLPMVAIAGVPIRNSYNALLLGQANLMTLASNAIHFGFVTTVEIESLGLCGGLLLLNSVARPLEFHCTLPVKPSRSQEILFGKSLRPFLCSQVIGKALLEKTKTQPHVLVTDCPNTLDLVQCTNAPLAFAPHEDYATESLDANWNRMEVGEQAILLRVAESAKKLSEVNQWLEHYGNNSEFAEPFERIKQAIYEAHQVARKSA